MRGSAPPPPPPSAHLEGDQQVGHQPGATCRYDNARQVPVQDAPSPCLVTAALYVPAHQGEGRQVREEAREGGE